MPTLYLPTLRPDQATIAKTLSSAQFVVLAMGRRWGKTVLGEVLCLTFAARGGKVAWVVPSYKNGRPLWRMVRRVLAPFKAAALVRINETDRIVEFAESVGGGFLGMYTGEDNCDAMRGEDFDLVVVDEAAKVSEIAWTDAILPTLADRNGRAMLISTPRGRNWFWHWWCRGQDTTQSEVRSFTAPSSANPNPRIQRAARLARERVPERTYAQEWLAEFVEDAGGVFHNVRGCLVEGTLDETPRHPRAYRHAIGLDLAKHADFTVAVVVDLSNHRVVHVERWNQCDWALTKARVHLLSATWDHPTIWMDATGVGDPIYDDLLRAGLHVEPYKFTLPTKAALIENAVLVVEQRKCEIPNCEGTRTLVSELEAYEYARTPSGNLKMSAPEGMHDDCVIAFALGVWPMAGESQGIPAGVLEHLTAGGSAFAPIVGGPGYAGGWKRDAGAFGGMMGKKL